LGSVDAARNAAGAASAEIRGIYNLGEIFLGIFAVGIIIFNGFCVGCNKNEKKKKIPFHL